jgi:hypothetical protein
MTPGTYLRKRREAAGLSVEQVALVMAGKFGNLPRAEQSPLVRAAAGGVYGAAAAFKGEIERLERDELLQDRSPIYIELVRLLDGAFPFDRNVFFALLGLAADPGLPCPAICRNCTCSWNDACIDALRRPCSWAEVGADELPICTFCAADEPGPGEQLAIPPAANEGEARHAA